MLCWGCDESGLVRPNQEANMGVCIIDSKSLRFCSSRLKLKPGVFKLKLGQLVFPNVSVLGAPKRQNSADVGHKCSKSSTFENVALDKNLIIPK